MHVKSLHLHLRGTCGAEARADGLVNVQHAVAQVPGALTGPQAQLRRHLYINKLNFHEASIFTPG